jgi:hypothetical protein
MKKAKRVTRTDTHRPCVMDVEADAAPEGAWKPLEPPASPWIGAIGVAAIVAIALLATAALVWP